MGLILLTLMVAVPIGEIAVFIEAGDQFGLWPTIGAVILTAIIGTAFLRIQGLSVIRRVQESLQRNELPVSEVFDGLCLLVAGALLLTPGFITDAVGFCLLVSPLRRMLASLIANHLIRSGKVQGLHAQGRRPTQNPTGNGPVIDGEFEEVEPGQDARPDSNNDKPQIGPK